MKFRSRVDSAYLGTLGSVILLMIFLSRRAIFINNSTDLHILPVAVILSVVVILAWFTFTTGYAFRKDDLLLKTGFIRKRIKYTDIAGFRKVRGINEMMGGKGFQMHTSKDGLEVYYNTSKMRSVKISPQREELFILHLLERCPQLETSALSENA